MKNRKKWLIALIMTTIVVCFFVWQARRPSHLLLDKAAKVSGIRLGYQGDSYLWLPGQEILIFHPVSALRWVIVRRNAGTSAETALPMLTRLFQQTGGNPWSGKVSPDGCRLIWAGIGKRIYEATLSGTGFEQWTYGTEEGGECYWLSDSRRFVRFPGRIEPGTIGPGPFVLRDTEASGRVQRLPLRWTQDELKREQLTSLLANQRSPTRVYAEAGACDSERQHPFVTVSIFGPLGARVETAEVPLPPGFFLSERSVPYRLSDGGSLIWRLGSPNISHQPNWVQHQPGWVRRLLGYLWGYPQPINTLGMYVSHADGLGWRFVGDWKESALLQYDEQQGERAPGNFRWLPGDRQISFEYQNGLYTVPAN